MYLIKFFDFLFSLPEGNDPIESKLELSKVQLFPVFGFSCTRKSIFGE